MIIAWWSGGVTSAIACKMALDMYEDVHLVMLDTMNEDEDTYRFKADCEKWYGVEIELFKHLRWSSIDEVWWHFKSLSNATGAICSKELKAIARQLYCKDKNISAHVFGFEYSKKEINRAESWKKNQGLAAHFPLIEAEITKDRSFEVLEKQGIELPRVYRFGYNNNNCFNTGCTQGGAGYWQKIGRDDFAKYNRMAQREHDLSELKGEPVVVLHKQGDIYDPTGSFEEKYGDKFKYTQDIKKGRIVTKWDISKKTGIPYSKSKCFLRFNIMFPEIPTVDTIDGRHEPIYKECNGFCSAEENTNQLDFMELFDNA
jgi:3'-phosphoadenosine 5'-phosphosulfate sulfotransferase (PAPS reductase)/FAD synthetase